MFDGKKIIFAVCSFLMKNFLILSLTLGNFNSYACIRKMKNPKNNSSKEEIQNIDNQEIFVKDELRSLQGVVNEISYYCCEAGVIPVNETVEVCFKEDVPNCSKIRVKGRYEIRKISESPNRPCPAGERKSMMVSSVQCLD